MIRAVASRKRKNPVNQTHGVLQSQSWHLLLSSGLVAIFSRLLTVGNGFFTVSAACAVRGLVGSMAASPPVGNLHPAPKLNLLQLSSFGISTVVRLSYHGFFRFASVFVTVPSNLVVTIC